MTGGTEKLKCEEVKNRSSFFESDTLEILDNHMETEKKIHLKVEKQ